VPFKSVKDLIAYAKANPGKLSFASNGEGGFPHMTIEMLRVQAGFTYLHVPYKGSGQIAAELMGGHVDAAIDGYTGMAPHVQSGKLRLLGITSPTRVPQLPNVPGDRRIAAGLRLARLVRLARAGRHPARNRLSPQPGDQPRDAASDVKEKLVFRRA